MATTYEKIRGFLDAMELKYKMKEEEPRIYIGFPTKHYADQDGDKRLFVVILLEEDGEYLKVYAPTLYTCKDGPNKQAVLQTCLMVSWKTKLIQFEYDDTDGEIRAIIEFPLEDAELTRKQFTRVLFGLVQLVDKYHPAFDAAFKTGAVDFSALVDGSQLRKLITAAEELGPDGLREVMEEIARRGAGEGGGAPTEV